MARPEPINFLELPIEVLGQILQPLLTTPDHTPILLCPCSPAPFPPRSVVSILLTHPRLHAIACPLLYGPSNSFLLDLTGEHSSHVRRRREVFETAQDDRFLINEIGNHSNSHRHAPDGSFFSLPTHRRRRPLLATAPALRRLQNLTIRVDRLRGWIQDDIVPVVSDMIMHGHLQQLRLYLATTTQESLSSSSSSSPMTGVRRTRIAYPPPQAAAGRPPLAGLLRLLADPDLGHSGLWIEGRHLAGWDQFQRDDTSQELGAGDGSRRDGRDERDLVHHHEEVVELDWRKLLESAAEMQAADWQTSV
ncbi:unnamed protein product [Clonostachys byssicola]|uniref:Uncharacterized protein n=1 Tax=Clonostachys byssicola TaxID=160290 RepID=A0A9N9UFT3_9HYPO|nr:unnamed protein product [Clonostachys byssicola]